VAQGPYFKILLDKVLSYDPWNIHAKFHLPQSSGLRALGF